MLTLLPQFEVQLELFPGFWSQSLSSLQSLFLADHHLINDNDDHDDDDDDIYIMMKCVSVCVFVTKNDHFLLGVSCNHLNHP